MKLKKEIAPKFKQAAQRRRKAVPIPMPGLSRMKKSEMAWLLQAISNLCDARLVPTHNRRRLEWYLNRREGMNLFGRVYVALVRREEIFE